MSNPHRLLVIATICLGLHSIGATQAMAAHSLDINGTCLLAQHSI